MKTQITANELDQRRAPARIQREFERVVARSLADVDSAAGDREIRQMVAETFAARLAARAD